MRSGIFALVLMAALAACARQVPPETYNMDQQALRAALARCCAGEDRYPPGLIRVVEGAAFSAIPFSRSVLVRAPYLQDAPGASAAILGQAEPLDLILVVNRAHLSGVLGTGYFGHSILYFGGEDGLRQLGLWQHPAIRPYQAQIRAGALAIEAIEGGVRLADAHQVMDADVSALFRPRTLSPEEKRRAIIYTFEQIGTPFDLHFDMDSDEVLFCTELVAKALPEMELPVATAYGRRVVWPDELAAKSLIGKTGFELITYIKGARSGAWRRAGWSEMARDILAAWPVPDPGVAAAES